MNELYDVLKTSKTSDFLIREEQTESREAFFIGQKLDMSRAKKVTHTFLTVFVDSEDGKFRGSAEKEIHQGISREEMQQEIDDFSELCELDPSYCGYEAQGQKKSEEK